MDEPQSDPHERRRHQRHPAAVSATLELIGPAPAVRFEIKEAIIWSLSYAGLGLSVTVEAEARGEELSGLFARGRHCRISGTIPGRERPSRLRGKVVWVSPLVSPGTEVRVGFSLEENAEEELADLRDFVARREQEENES